MSPGVPATETIVACLTPAGRGAIATLALWGPRAWDVVRQLFRSLSAAQPQPPQKGDCPSLLKETVPFLQLPAEPEIGRVWLGRLGEDTTDEVVVAAKETWPVPWVEVHCHGGREVIRLLLETFEAHGLRVCTWQEFQQQTSGDLLRSAAVAALADAVTARTAGILLDQYHGAFGRAIQDILSSWENADPPKRGLSLSPQRDSPLFATDKGTRLLQSLVRYAGLGRHLTAPWRLVVAGAPNVGKSSLINALAGYQRCVVAPTPGTTRDLVTTLIAIDGWPIELVDTAGLRTEGEVLEEQGIALARQAVRAADLCLWVLDASAAPVWPDFPIPTVEKGDCPFEDRGTVPFFLHLVVNKVDLEAAWDLDQAVGALRVSAKDGSGLSDLCDAFSHWLVPEPPPPGSGVPFTALLAGQVEEAWRHHAAGRTYEAKQVLANLVRC